MKEPVQITQHDKPTTIPLHLGCPRERFIRDRKKKFRNFQKFLLQKKSKLRLGAIFCYSILNLADNLTPPITQCLVLSHFFKQVLFSSIYSVFIQVSTDGLRPGRRSFSPFCKKTLWTDSDGGFIRRPQ